jgi:hypothetical protein
MQWPLQIVDEVIDLCSETFQLRESIETIYQRAEETKQENIRKGLIKDGPWLRTQRIGAPLI